MSRVVMLMLLILVLSACSDESLTGPSAVQGLPWRLQSIHPTGADAIRIDAPDRFTALFEADGRLAVQADCNRCAGTYTVDGRRLQIGAVACTRAFCSASAPIDTRYVELLGRATRFEAGEEELTLLAEGGRLRFTR